MAFVQFKRHGPAKAIDMKLRGFRLAANGDNNKHQHFQPDLRDKKLEHKSG
jgi:hypothetical protein